MINIYIDDRILERHRTFLKESSLLQKIDELLEENFVNDLMKKYGKKFAEKHSAFCCCLVQEYMNMDDGQNKNIFLGTPEYLQAFIERIKQMYGPVQRKIETTKEYANHFYQAFGYDYFVNSHGPINDSIEDEGKVEYTLENFCDIEKNFRWGAYAYVMSLKVKVCPYCNRNYVLPLYSEEGKMRADLDHFFAKSKYPYLSISIYNLVPSCKYCNSSLKGKQEFTYEGNFHPLDKIRADDLYRITYIPKSTDCFLGKEDFAIKLEYNCADENYQKIKGNSDMLKIQKTYQYHKDIVAQFIKKRYIYDDGYIEYLLKTYPSLFSAREEVISFLLAPYDISQPENAPLGKLMKDLIEEMGF